MTHVFLLGIICSNGLSKHVLLSLFWRQLSFWQLISCHSFSWHLLQWQSFLSLHELTTLVLFLFVQISDSVSSGSWIQPKHFSIKIRFELTSFEPNSRRQISSKELLSLAFRLKWKTLSIGLFLIQISTKLFNSDIATTTINPSGNKVKTLFFLCRCGQVS